ncbi:YlxR family protein [Tepidibacillus infernus]|uniref:RNA-binding protein n=1 Tax=Tepidibacillus decaturensis TaxID=1413211 RepID=A0A135L3I7_9BACI|nr:MULTISPECIES: YlxR family protein [Tepidibacillus]KXG43423.1 RNA-binding protein [Tepidibacillus decaturensis]GBF11280.1 hypothetical protein HK1_01304 [Tepidibacillus sp. HK-1]
MKTRKIPMRKCVACQEMKPKKELIRIVRTPEKEIIVDFTGKKSGRGAYLCRQGECFQIARKKKQLERSLEVKIDDDIYEQLQLEINGRNE